MTQITLDPEKFGERVAALVKTAMAPYLERLEEVEKKILEGQARFSEAELIRNEGLKTVIDLVATEIVHEAVKEFVVDYMEKNPAQPGKDADPAVIAQMVKTAVDAIPPAKDGADGVGLAGALIDREGELIVTTTKGEAIKLGRVVGADGKDGLAVEDFSGSFDAERGFILSATARGQTKEFAIPTPRHQGFYTEGMKCFQGASVTHDGSLWIAKRDTTAKPCRENDQDWILAARKGRDAVAVKSAPRERGPIRLESSNG